MAVPKKRVGHSAQGHRRSNWKATVPETTTCKNCGALALTHTVCEACGFYKGKAVSIKAEGYVESAIEEKPKKAPKKSTKKVEKVEEKETAVETVAKETEE
jgi:large subunit ribosomal protein L32